MVVREDNDMDITNYICQAEKLGFFSSKELENLIESLDQTICFDYHAYEPNVENWAVLSKKTGEMCMIHTKLKLIFTNIVHFPKCNLEIVLLNFKKYSEKKWSIDIHSIDYLNNVFDWHTRVIDTSNFSTEELFYATV